jgi:exonuclease VII large subunit
MRGAQSGFSADPTATDLDAGAKLDKAFLDKLWNTTSQYWMNKKKKQQTTWAKLSDEIKQSAKAGYTTQGLKARTDADNLQTQAQELQNLTPAQKAERLKQKVQAQKLSGEYQKTQGRLDQLKQQSQSEMDKQVQDLETSRSHMSPQEYEQGVEQIYNNMRGRAGFNALRKMSERAGFNEMTYLKSKIRQLVLSELKANKRNR